MKKFSILALIAISAASLSSVPAHAWTVYEEHGSWVQIKCGSGTLRGVKQKSNGKWADTADLSQNFPSFSTAADFICRGRGG